MDKIYDEYYYRYNIYIKKTMDVNGYDVISWTYPSMKNCKVSYKLNKNTYKKF